MEYLERCEKFGVKRTNTQVKLSVANKQRVAICRALCIEAKKSLLFDEPSSGARPRD